MWSVIVQYFFSLFAHEYRFIGGKKILKTIYVKRVTMETQRHRDRETEWKRCKSHLNTRGVLLVVVCRNDVMSFSTCFLFCPISVVNSTFRLTILHSSILNSFFYSTKTARSMETIATTATAAVMCSFVLFQFSSCWFSMASDFNTCRNMKSFLFALCTWKFHQSNRVLLFHGDDVPKEKKIIHLL